MAVGDKLVLVTGAKSGIGAAAVHALAEAGFVPVAADVRPVADTDLPAGTVRWEGSLDVSDEAQVAAAVHQIEEQHGAIAGLVNAAGILGKMHPPERLQMKDWDREIAVDLRGTYLMCRTVGTRMCARRAGSIVNIASIVASSPAPVHAYGPAKAAVVNLTATLAAEWGPRGIRVNAISPGFTRTPSLEEAFEVGALSRERMIQMTALGRLVEPSEIAQAIVWLIGSNSSAVTGINLIVDAGFLAGSGWTAYGGLR